MLHALNTDEVFLLHKLLIQLVLYLCKNKFLSVGVQLRA